MAEAERAYSSSPAVTGASRWVKYRARTALLLLLLDVITLVVAVGGVHGHLRFVTGLAMALTVPGWSVVGFLDLRNAPLVIGVTVSVSLSLLMLLAQVIMALHMWHLFGLEVAVGLTCVPLLTWQASGWRRSRSRGGSSNGMGL